MEVLHDFKLIVICYICSILYFNWKVQISHILWFCFFLFLFQFYLHISLNLPKWEDWHSSGFHFVLRILSSFFSFSSNSCFPFLLLIFSLFIIQCVTGWKQLYLCKEFTFLILCKYTLFRVKTELSFNTWLSENESADVIGDVNVVEMTASSTCCRGTDWDICFSLLSRWNDSKFFAPMLATH